MGVLHSAQTTQLRVLELVQCMLQSLDPYLFTDGRIRTTVGDKPGNTVSGKKTQVGGGGGEGGVAEKTQNQKCH